MGIMQEFAEVDKAGWFDLATACKKLVKGQQELMDAAARQASYHNPHLIAPDSIRFFAVYFVLVLGGFRKHSRLVLTDVFGAPRP